MLRWIVTAGFLGTAGLTVWVTFLMGAETPRGNLLINLGTEMVGNGIEGRTLSSGGSLAVGDVQCSDLNSM